MSSWAERLSYYLLLVCQGWTQPAPPSTVALKKQQPGPKLSDNGCVDAPGGHGAETGSQGLSSAARSGHGPLVLLVSAPGARVASSPTGMGRNA